MNAANNGILKRLFGNQNLTVSFSEEETGDIKANVFSLLLSIYKSRVESEVRGSIWCPCRQTMLKALQTVFTKGLITRL